ncbi:MAG TPA: hypothetical protein VK066_00290 [Chloroflexota bacterium]|nr:hypothetical protein [Chloroflexota bacterium]
MRRLLLVALLTMTSLAVGGAQRVLAQDADATAAPTTFGQFLRASGLTVSDAELAYLDADERLEQSYMLALTNLQLLAATPAEQQNDQWRQSLTAELNRLISMDPAGVPQAPPSLQRFRDMGIEHRRHIQQAAQQWLAGVQANDPQWNTRGADEERAAGESYTAWMQELAARFPPPQSSDSQQP